MDVSIKEICQGGAFVIFMDEAVIEKCVYINSQEEHVEQVFKLESVMMQGGSNSVHIFAYNPVCRLNAPLAKFTVRGFNFQIQRTAEIAIADYGIEMISPVTLGVLENSKVNYFSIIKDGSKLYSYLILNPPQNDDYYYRIMFK